MSLKDKKQQDSKSEHSSRGGGYFKFQEGENIIRVLAEPFVIFKDFNLGICYTDCGFQGAMKYLTYVWNRKTNQVQRMEMPMTIFDLLEKWEEKKSTKFEGFPMPYDMEIDAENAGTKEVKYVALPGERDEVPADILDQLKKLKPIPELIQSLKDANKEKHLQDGTWDKMHEGSDTPRPAQTFNGKTQEDYNKEYPADINPDDIPF